MSNIAIVCGYAFDLKKVKSKNYEAAYQYLEEMAEENDLELITGYSVSAYEPTCMVVGKQLQDITMFSPTDLKVGPDAVDVPQIKFKLPKDTEQLNTEPKVMVFGYSDD